MTSKNVKQYYLLECLKLRDSLSKIFALQPDIKEASCSFYSLRVTPVKINIQSAAVPKVNFHLCSDHLPIVRGLSKGEVDMGASLNFYPSHTKITFGSQFGISLP